MTMTKINFDLTGVPHTLLFPLIGRAMASKEKDSPLKDQRAIQIIESLNFDFEDLIKKMKASFGSFANKWAADRAIYLDNEIKSFLAKHPSGTVVNMGAGLETAFYRVDNGKLTWVDLDLPQVIELRKKILTPPERVYYIAKSVSDFTWMEEVKKYGEEVFFFAGGLFMYLMPEQIKSLFLEMLKQFPHSELVFDSITKENLDEANSTFAKFELKDVKFNWGVDEAELLSWSPKLKILYNNLYSSVPTENKLDDSEVSFHGHMTKIIW